MSYLEVSAYTTNTSDVVYDSNQDPWGIRFYNFDNIYVDLNASEASLGTRALFYDSELNGLDFSASSGTAVGTGAFEYFKAL